MLPSPCRLQARWPTLSRRRIQKSPKGTLCYTGVVKSKVVILGCVAFGVADLCLRAMSTAIITSTSWYALVALFLSYLVMLLGCHVTAPYEPKEQDSTESPVLRTVMGCFQCSNAASTVRTFFTAGSSAAGTARDADSHHGLPGVRCDHVHAALRRLFCLRPLLSGARDA